jgi:uncharacterized repeat protein (TIGR03803 family)
LYDFSTNANDGVLPEAGLVQGSDGNFYRTTSGGGVYGQSVGGYGTVFQITTNGALTTLYSFTGGNKGAEPLAGLVQGSDGYFYGTTFGGSEGGVSSGGNGTVFRISSSGALTTLYSFDFNDGAGPTAGLVQGSDGNFYGTTPAVGNQAGTVFQLAMMPEFLSVTLTNSTLNLTWSTEVGGMYVLQYNSELNSSNWTNLGSPVSATGVTLSTTDSLTNGPQRFYRVVLSP